MVQAFETSCPIDNVQNIPVHLRIVARMVALLLLAFCRGCHMMIEQPCSSVMPYHPYIQYLKHVVGGIFHWGSVCLPLGDEPMLYRDAKALVNQC